MLFNSKNFYCKISIHRQVSKTFQIFSIFNLPQNQFDWKAIFPWTNFHENPLEKCNYFSIICRTLWGSTKHIFVKRILTATFKDCSNFLRLEICLSHNRFIYHFLKAFGKGLENSMVDHNQSRVFFALNFPLNILTLIFYWEKDSSLIWWNFLRLIITHKDWNENSCLEL